MGLESAHVQSLVCMYILHLYIQVLVVDWIAAHRFVARHSGPELDVVDPSR